MRLNVEEIKTFYLNSWTLKQLNSQFYFNINMYTCSRFPLLTSKKKENIN